MELEEAKKEGFVLYSQRKYKPALEIFSACGTDPLKDSELAFFMGFCYARLKEDAKAIELLAFVERNEENFLYVCQSRLALSYLYAVSGRYAEAEALLKKLNEDGLQKAQIYALWGYVAQRMEDYDAAARRYKAAIELDPENANALNSLGYLYAERNENIHEALTFCRRAVSLNPENPFYLDSLGWACFRMGRIKDALEYLQRALKAAPSHETIKKHLQTVQQKASAKK